VLTRAGIAAARPGGSELGRAVPLALAAPSGFRNLRHKSAIQSSYLGRSFPSSSSAPPGSGRKLPCLSSP